MMRVRHWVYTIPLRLRSLFLRQNVDQELNAELSYHLERKTEEYTAKGMTTHEARRIALLEMGGIEKVTEQCRSVRRVTGFQDLIQDTRYSSRVLRKAPGFAVVVILTLALGIGANTAVFSVVYAVLLRPLPYQHPQELVAAFQSNEYEAAKERFTSYQDLEALQQSGAFSNIGGVARHDLTLTGIGDPGVVTTVSVTPEIFPVLNVSPLLGRYLLSDDEFKGAAPVVVLSEGLWRTRFGANPNILGTSITLDQRSFTIVGIMPAGFRVPLFGPHQNIWIPIVDDPLFGPWLPNRGIHGLGVVGRLREGLTIGGAQAQMETLSAQLAKDFPAESNGWRVRLEPLQAVTVGDIKTPLLILLGAVGFVLLLACINVANLLLARATSRAREIALRQALGAARGRIIRQLLSESAVLGGIGAVLGVAVAYLTAQTLGRLLPANQASTQPIHVDGWVLGFALLLSMAAVVGFGLVPALVAANSNLQMNLKDSAAQSGSSGSRMRIRSFLAATEIALAMVLVVAAGLLVRSLASIRSVNPGFEASHIVKADVSLPRYQYSTSQQWSAFSDTLLEQLKAQPGMKDSAIGVPLPLVDDGVKLKFTIADHAALPAGTPNIADYVSVSPGYFQVMGIPLMRGRLFAGEDSRSSTLVTIISESFARSYFRDEDPLGKRLVFAFHGDPPLQREIIGIVGNVRDAQLTREPGPMMYVPFAQAPFWGGEIVVKSTLPPSAVVGSIREAVRSIDKDLPVTNIATLPELLDASIAQPRFRTWLLSMFGGVALLLAAAGVYGVVSYSVACRTREFGVRAALGASPTTIGKMILTEGLGLAGIGLAVGLAAALGLVRFLRGELYGVATYDAMTFLMSGVVLLGVALVACFIPACRAMWVDPMITLRCE